MTNKLARVLPIVSGDTSLPQLNYATLTAAGTVVPEFEEDALEDYLFDQNTNAVLSSRINPSVLSLAGAAPTYSSDHLTVGGGINGLITSTSGLNYMTFAAVFKRPASDPSGALAIIGNDTGPATNTGAGIYIAGAGGYVFNIRPGTGDPNFSANAQVPQGSWGFIAGSLGPTTARLYLGGPTPVTATGTGITRTLGPSVGLGKVRNMGASYVDDPLSLHRATLFAREFTLAELNALYQRFKVVAARRGITVV